MRELTVYLCYLEDDETLESNTALRGVDIQRAKTSTITVLVERKTKRFKLFKHRYSDARTPEDKELEVKKLTKLVNEMLSYMENYR